MPDAQTRAPRTGILVTRPEPGLSETCRHLAARGLHPIQASLFAIEPRPVKPIPASHPQAALVTSAHALAALDPAIPLVFAVGDATAARARALGARAVHSAGGDAGALLALCRARLTPKAGPLLLHCGEGQAMRLAADLRLAGFRVIRRVVYAQRPAAQIPDAALEALRAESLAAALFMSANAAHVFARLLPPSCHTALRRVDALAISPAASKPIAALPWQSVRVALRPTAEDVLALL